MSETPRPPGKTTVAPEVLLTIAKLTTLKVPGVSRLNPAVGSINRLLNPGASEGVRLEIHDDLVYADLHVILKHDTNIREVSRNIQRSVARALSDMVGMSIGRINIHIEDIDYSNPAES